MTFNVKFTEDVKKFLKKLDKHTAKFILAWIRKNLEGCTNPRHTGKGLTSNRSGQWRYRVGDYRKGNLSGYWSRHIDGFNRLIYRIVEDTIEIIACKGSIMSCSFPLPAAKSAMRYSISAASAGVNPLMSRSVISNGILCRLHSF